MKLRHHQHSGRLRPHEHTSYAPLLCLVLAVGLLMAGWSISVFAAGDPPPQANSVSLTGSVPAPPPKTAATITSPASQQHFATSPITVSGACPANTLVEIYKNDIFAGSTPCGDDGKYSVQVDLLFGKNSITAQVYDVLNQAGPVSQAITVFYDATLPQSAGLSFLNFSGTQLMLDTDAVYRGSFPGQTINMPISIIGGSEPFAVNVEWGDSKNQVIPRGDNTVFNASHAYDKPGTYQITIQATDSQQRVAFLTVAAIVNGQPSLVATANTSKTPTGKLLILWPLYAVVATLVVSFWMGEQREKHVLRAVAATGTKTPPMQNTPLGPTPQPQT